MEIPRHFSIGSLALTRQMVKLYSHTTCSTSSPWKPDSNFEVPEYSDKDIMLGHWHRPPLSVVFKRPNGTAIEVGTGSDIWRWEENLGYAPESGSYKIILTKDGLQFIREPLACCENFAPELRPYRFSWFIAWRENGANKKLPKHNKIEVRYSPNGEMDMDHLKTEIANSNFYPYAVLDFSKKSRGMKTR